MNTQLKIALLTAITVIFTSWSVSAQSSLKYTLYVAYDTEEIIREQSEVATILAGEGLEVDGVEATIKNMRYANHTPSRPRMVIVDVSPGIHKVRVLYHVSGGNIIMEPIEFNFEKGKIYRMGIKFFSMVIEEHPSTKVKGQIDMIRKSADYRQP